MLAAVAFTGGIVLSLLLFNWPNLRNYRQAVLVSSALEGNVSLMEVLLVVGADTDGFECPNVRCRLCDLPAEELFRL